MSLAAQDARHAACASCLFFVGTLLSMGKTKLNAVTQALVHIDPDKHPLFLRLKESGNFIWLTQADEAPMKTLDGLGLLCIVDDPNMFKETLDMAVLAPEIKNSLKKRWLPPGSLPQQSEES